MIELTSHQTLGLQKLDAAYRANTISCLSGYAGTGKSSIIKHFTEVQLGLSPSQIIYITYTGKASVVLQKKGLPSLTIHSFLYRWEMIDGEFVKYLKNYSEFPELKLIVIDEVSMVTDELMTDLATFIRGSSIKIVCLGDIGQLPPISEKASRIAMTLLKNSCFNLEEFMRFSENSGIYELSYDVRTGRPLKERNYGNAKVVKKDKLNRLIRDSLVSQDSQILVTTNTRRYEVNNKARELLGFEGVLPEVGEKVIFTQNNWNKTSEDRRWVIVNGLMGTVNSTESSHRELYGLGLYKTEVAVEGSAIKGIWADAETFLDAVGKNHQEFDKNRKLRYIQQCEQGFRTNLNYLDFGYGITIHKAQGSEFDNVLLVWDAWGNTSFKKKLLYTGVTRASGSLIVTI